jgi:uroporphyrinogen-III synthase
LATNDVNIVVTREDGKNDTLMAWLPTGVMVDEVPLTTTLYFDPDDVRAALASSPASGTFRSLVVTSERGAHYVEIARHASTSDVEVFGVGATTSSALTTRGIRVHAQGDGSADALAPYISRGPVLLLGAQSMREELITALREKGLEVETVACYETVGLALDPSDAATLRNADVIFIGAPSAWTVAREYVKSDAWVVVPGATTGATVRFDHARVIEGWGPQLKTRLAELSH